MSKIHLFAAFFSGSHAAWAQGLTNASKHDVKLYSLPGKFWKWRMHGAAVYFAEQFLAQAEQPDLLVFTDMLDVATFLALTRSRTANIPNLVYFHENQLTYPWSPTDEDVDLKRDRHYAWINYSTALAADQIWFNSQYHLDSFVGALPKYLSAFPDFKGLNNVAHIQAKAKVMYLGMQLERLQAYRPKQKDFDAPLLLWNHRWEYDKNPDAFFELCYRLDAAGLHFKLAVLGEQYPQSPAVFKQAQERLADRIVHWGYAASYADYAYWLWQADVLPVTSRQDFFGGSVVEAMYCQTYPLLPNRLAFPEHIPLAVQEQHLYQTDEQLFEQVKALLAAPKYLETNDFQQWVAHYDWQEIGKEYDEQLQNLIGRA